MNADVIVIGGGPAGSTAANLLAQAGHDVLVLERELFPRYHIGESLLPVELPLFERLGFDAKGLPSLYKQGADFRDERTGDLGRFSFEEALEGTPAHAWQVERSTFDLALLDRAEQVGARVRQGTTVKAVSFYEKHVEVHVDGVHSETLRARFVIDATGRDRLLSKQHRAYERIDGLGVAAVYAQYSGLSPASQAELYETGNITVLLLDEGWAWAIPLMGGVLSVGFVSPKKGVVSKTWFDAQCAASEFLSRVTEGADRGELQLTGDYSYKNTQPTGARFACIGDSAGFLDPVFSSGVTLAMTSAEKLADILCPALEAGEEAAEDLMAPLNAEIDHAYAVFGAVLNRFYHRELVQKLFFYEDPDVELRAGLVSILAGDVWRTDNKFQDMLLRTGRRSREREAPKNG